MVFVGGLHRSGTTALARCLAAHPLISGFSGTAAREDEGQHLQTVYPRVKTYGGAGRFAFAEAAHLTEQSPLATADARERLLSEWEPHWDLSRPFLVEKSPPNLLMTRFLQSIFPEAYFVMILRHPVVVSLSTHKWRRQIPLGRLAEHWFHAHDVFAADAPYVRRLHVLKYEDLVTQPTKMIADISEFIGLDEPAPTSTLQSHRSNRYEQQWNAWASSRSPCRWLRYRQLCQRFEDRAQRYGYSMRDLTATQPWVVPSNTP